MSDDEKALREVTDTLCRVQTEMVSMLSTTLSALMEEHHRVLVECTELRRRVAEMESIWMAHGIPTRRVGL